MSKNYATLYFVIHSNLSIVVLWWLHEVDKINIS